ncbi:MAG: gliding motility-associated C-terminal domain-containing protein, partial [Bacteroidota bacterium]
IVPEKAIPRPKNITNTAQITFKASTGHFEVTDVQSINGVWRHTATVKSPEEAPNFDYIVFSLVTPMVNPDYQANMALPLFSFKNGQGCIGSIELIENVADEFWPPNSLNVNVGTQLTILEYGLGNAYEQNDPTQFKVTCPIALNYQLKVDPVKCAGQSGQLTIILEDGELPFTYQINSIDGDPISGEILHEGDSVKMDLLAGTYDIFGRDQRDSLQKRFQLLAPPPLSIVVIEKQRLTCDDADGARVSVAGRGGWSGDNFAYSWSNGITNNEAVFFSPAVYSVTIADQHGCELAENIQIEADLPIEIDSFDVYAPTCHDSKDGMVEILSIKNGSPPYQYTLDNNLQQSNNYFDNLSGGVYRIVVTDAKNCVTEFRTELKAPPKLEILSLSFDSVLALGQSTTLIAAINQDQNVHYNWLPTNDLSCLDCSSPIARPTQSTQYTLEVSNDFGCTVSVTKGIKVLLERPIFIPNAISPNDDGQNDEFQIFLGPTVKSAKKLQIFNRWGQLVFATTRGENGQPLTWDGTFRGKQVEKGVYLYVADIIMDDGTSETYTGDFFVTK